MTTISIDREMPVGAGKSALMLNGATVLSAADGELVVRRVSAAYVDTAEEAGCNAGIEIRPRGASIGGRRDAAVCSDIEFRRTSRKMLRWAENQRMLVPVDLRPRDCRCAEARTAVCG